MQFILKRNRADQTLNFDHQRFKTLIGLLQKLKGIYKIKPNYYAFA